MVVSIQLMGDNPLNEMGSFNEDRSPPDGQQGNDNEILPRANEAVLSSMLKHRRDNQ